MRKYNKLTIYENAANIRLLSEFRELIIIYFSNLEHSGFHVDEKDEARRARTKINLSLDKIYLVIRKANVNPSIYYSPPPMIGGLAGNIDLVHNIFNLHNFQIEPQQLNDYLERAVGVYESDKLNAILRTINPLFWLSLLLDYIVSLPFKIIGKMGFNQYEAESSLIGKIIKGFLYLITVSAAFLTVLEKIGCLESFKLLVRGWLK